MIRHPHRRSQHLTIYACNGGTWSWSCNRCEVTGSGWFRLDYCEAAALKHERETHP
ncbi:MAG TPA: hypothetical protein PLH72_19570 [Vicinamibacterales bacterium]|nr:hypothetical protein [Vicinamibacterales bacterium]